MPQTTAPGSLIQRGDANRLYIDTVSDPDATENWVEIMLTEEVSPNDEPDAVELPGRFPDGVKRSTYGQIDGTLSFTMTVLKGDAVEAFLRNSKRLKKAVRVMVADRPRTAAGVVTMVDWFMVAMPRKEPSSGNTTIEVTLTPTAVVNASGVLQGRVYSPSPS